MTNSHSLDPKYERWRWRTFGVTWLIYAGFYFTRQSSTFSVAKVALTDDPRINLSREQLGWIDSASLSTYMVILEKMKVNNLRGLKRVSTKAMRKNPLIDRCYLFTMWTMTPTDELRLRH